MYVIHEHLRYKPKCRIELHVHLDGAIRPETAWELLRQKKLSLPGNGSLKDLKTAVTVQEPIDLDHFLSKFNIFMPAICDDLVAIERVAYEFVDDISRSSVIYSEARLCPQLLLSEFLYGKCAHAGEGNKLTVDDVLDATLKGLKRGEEDFESKVVLILCCIRGRLEWSWDVLRQCVEYRNKGVVGIDIVGNGNDSSSRDESFNIADAKVFDAAKEKGIRITVHAGEAGPAESVQQAIEILHAERIGHGYRVIENEEIYQKCLANKVHFEVCPHSSYVTGAMKHLQTASKRHPILKFAEDGASFSISTDDPTITGTCMDDEYKLLQSWGFTEAHFVRSNFEAVKNCFLPENEKQILIEKLTKAYGFPSAVSRPLTNNLSPPSETKYEVDAKPVVKLASWSDRS